MKIKYELWEKPIGEISGTVRTAKQNYYLADIIFSKSGELYLSRRLNFEPMTENITGRRILKEWLKIQYQAWNELKIRMKK
jgi:hypothetical protein